MDFPRRGFLSSENSPRATKFENRMVPSGLEAIRPSSIAFNTSSCFKYKSKSSFGWNPIKDFFKNFTIVCVSERLTNNIIPKIAIWTRKIFLRRSEM